MSTRQVVPEGIDAMSPGPALAGVLEGLDQTRVAGIDLSRVLQAWDRQLSWTTARWLDTIVELGLALPGPDATPRRASLLPLFAETEVRSALVCSEQVAAARQNEGAALRWSLPALRMPARDPEPDDTPDGTPLPILERPARHRYLPAALTAAGTTTCSASRSPTPAAAGCPPSSLPPTAPNHRSDRDQAG